MEEYFEKEYGKGHLESVVKDNDMESLYGLMQEYLDHSLKVELNCFAYLNDLKYVHELQNLFFALTGTELEIETLA
jgi:hypothetical protein